MRLPTPLLALSLLACATTDDPGDTAPTGFYQLEIETVADDCTPARSIQSAESLPIQSEPRGVVIRYPSGEASGPVAWSQATVLRRPAAPTLYEDLDCPGATSTQTIEILDETATSLDVDLVETWTGVSSCPAPERPATDCGSERILHFDLEEACEAPCELVPNDCTDGCTVEDPAWRCECSETLI